MLMSNERTFQMIELTSFFLVKYIFAEETNGKINLSVSSLLMDLSLSIMNLYIYMSLAVYS